MVFLSSKTKALVLISIVLIGVIILVWNPTFSLSYESRGKILPKKVFLIRTNASGGLESFLVDNRSGQLEDYSIYNFDRGDVVNYKFYKENKFISQGDTVVSVSSSIFSKELKEIEFSLVELQGDLEILASGEKEEIIDQLESQIILAEKQVETQQKIYNRAIKLLERNLISHEDFDIIEGQLEVNKVEVRIAKDMLAAAKTGAKQEEIEAVRQKIEAAKKIEANIIDKNDKLNIITPFNGKVQTYANNDTLLTVNSINENIITLPLPVSKLNQIKEGDKITIDTDYGAITITVETIDESIFFYNREPYFRIISESFEAEENLPINGVINCKVEMGRIDLITYLSSVIN